MRCCAWLDHAFAHIRAGRLLVGQLLGEHRRLDPAGIAAIVAAHVAAAVTTAVAAINRPPLLQLLRSSPEAHVLCIEAEIGQMHGAKRQEAVRLDLQCMR